MAGSPSPSRPAGGRGTPRGRGERGKWPRSYSANYNQQGKAMEAYWEKPGRPEPAGGYRRPVTAGTSQSEVNENCHAKCLAGGGVSGAGLQSRAQNHRGRKSPFYAAGERSQHVVG